MLPATEEEKADIVGYYLSQSPGAEVTFLQLFSVLSERLKTSHNGPLMQRPSAGTFVPGLS